VSGTKSSIDLREISTADLLTIWESLISQSATTKTKAALSRHAKSRRVLWATARSIEDQASRYKAETYRRMGVPFIGKTPGLVVYAASKHHKCCDGCGGTGGMNGKQLHWYTDDAESLPLPLMMAKRGAKATDVKAMIDKCVLLCVRCAKKRKVKFDKLGKPMMEG